MEEIKVSIITVVYNGARDVAKTIESVLSQNYVSRAETFKD